MLDLWYSNIHQNFLFFIYTFLIFLENLTLWNFLWFQAPPFHFRPEWYKARQMNYVWRRGWWEEEWDLMIIFLGRSGISWFFITLIIVMIFIKSKILQRKMLMLNIVNAGTMMKLPVYVNETSFGTDKHLRKEGHQIW